MRIMLCCHAPGPMRAAVAHRVALWRAKISESVLR